MTELRRNGRHRRGYVTPSSLSSGAAAQTRRSVITGFTTCPTRRSPRRRRPTPNADRSGRWPHRRPVDAVTELRSLPDRPPFSPAVQAVIVAAVERVIGIERERGEIARTDRAALAPEAQLYQDLIDQLLYGMAGLTADEVRGLEDRYERML